MSPHPNVRYPIRERFWLWVEKSPELDGCWLWTGGLDRDGYGKFKDGRSVRAARWIYEQGHGAIPPGLVIDHRCRVRACVRDSHLRLVTNRVNILIGEGLAPRNLLKTHCPAGHPYMGENLLVQGRRRVCLTCRRAGDARRHRERRADHARMRAEVVPVEEATK